MSSKKKPVFGDYKINKISGGDLLLEKPIFCDNGKSLIVSCKETCHLYNTTSGAHIKELFVCDSPIINLQFNRVNPNRLYAITQKGSIVSTTLDSENSRQRNLKLKARVLKNNKTPLFNRTTRDGSLEGEPHVDWGKTLENGVKFIHAVICEKIIYASWMANNETLVHLSAFMKKGTMWHNVLPIPAQVGLANAPNNFIVGKKILLCMSPDFVYVQDLLKTDVRKKHMIGEKSEVSCIALSQDESFFATGDSTGRILVWRNYFGKTPIKDIFHWHMLPVRTLTFTDLGTNMFSGGDENVLVKWSLSSRQKTFLPRLPSPLLHITLAPGTDTLAVSTADSRILILNMSLNCLTTIQHFSRWSAVGLSYRGSIFTYEPRTEALVLAGRTGHIQYLSIANSGRFLYTFDVTNRNFITRDREGLIENVEVRFAKFLSDGKWLVTAESGIREATLKFWQYVETSREFTLNTAVDAPHGLDGFSCLETSSDEQVITTGPDNKFRLWNLVETTQLQRIRTHWYQVCNAGYRDLPVTVADFACDGSIVGVGFGPALTVWDTDSCKLKCSLTPPLRRNNIKAVRFGNHEVCHLVVTGTDAELSCWNLVTLCMQWMVPLQLSSLVSDPKSLYMCAFSKKGGLFIFSPFSAFPELRLENVSESEVIGGIFVTKQGSFSVYFLTANQELYCLGDDKKAAPVTKEVSTTKPFTIPRAEKSTKDVKDAPSLNHILTPASTSPMVILDGPAHTLPPVSLLLNDVLKSLLLIVAVPDKPVASTTEDEVVIIDTQNLNNERKFFFDEPQLCSVVERLFKEE